MSRNTSVNQVAAAQVISATGQIGQPWASEGADEMNIDVAVTVAGTTITIAAETSPDNGTTWFPHTAFGAITATGNTELKLTGNCGKLMRLNTTAVTGSFTASIWAVSKRKGG